MYFAFNTTEYVRILVRHFDNLVRNVEVHAHEISDFLSSQSVD